MVVTMPILRSAQRCGCGSCPPCALLDPQRAPDLAPLRRRM